MSTAALEKVSIIPPADPWDWWRNALKGVFGHKTADEPMTGFYRSRRKDKQTGQVAFYTVAYWYKDDGTLCCHYDGRPVDDIRAREMWTYVCERPITHELYTSIRNGGSWPDLNEVVIGHNNAPVEDTVESIQERIDDLAREAERMMKAGAASEQAIADQASDLANTFGELQNKIVDLHKKEKAPHLEAGRTVDKKWFGLRDRAEDLKKRLKAVVVTPWLTKKAQEAEAAKVAAITSGKSLEEAPQVRVTSGSSKRSTGLRTYFFAEITDKAKLLESLKDHPRLVALLQEIADDAAKKQVALPGCVVKSDKRAA
ncbi:hypothetical protein I6F35_33455 [Bradyrhizobium sp. BRP22]|uniref:hypothetical protein n=1 Tax=Bradyrhizobium sp. BRP22 TaxID=2793821 RepID=UPI001CD6F30F|nr:hypothetical protein [Bradyrhizobium sp. BRP22]MCA1458042.1 hypothetical protein [Bradyrhizobium sp. BRP22]